MRAVDARDKMGRTALYRAARKGDTDQVKRLVAHGADIHAVTENGKSVLSASARSGDTAAIDFLLSRGADVNAMDEDNRSVLYHAARKGQLESMRLLVQRGANLHATTDVRLHAQNKVTVLHALAYSSDNAAALAFILDCGADINATTERGSTALHVAVGEGHVECMKLLVQRGADIHATTKEGKTALHVAAERNEDADMVAYLVDSGVDINAADENGSTALHYSARRGHVESMTFLIQHNADIHATTADGRTVLHAAVGSSNDHIDTLKYLIDHGVDINAVDEDGWTALVEAVRGGHTESMKLLIQRGADIHATTESKRTILHWATERSDDIGTLQYLLDHRVDINAVDEDGWTALSYAVSEGHLKSMKFLIQRGADIHAVAKDGKTILHAAAAGRDDAVALEYLIEGGADINAADEDGRTPLHDAASNGHAECMRFLIQRGADIRVITKDGRTALQEAAAGADDAVALGYLIDGGADINAADEDGRTALYDAACNGHVECMRFLIQRGADIHATTKDGETLLLAAAFSRNPIAVRLMVEVGLAIDAVNNEGDTALHYLACHNGDVATMQLLVESGADIHAINAKGQSVLHSAVEGCELKATRYLIGQGLSVDATDAAGRTTLHYAAQQGGLAMLPFLVAQGGNIHALTKHRMGLLHFAVQGADLHVLDYVLKLGVDINPRVENIDEWMSPLGLSICAADHQDSYRIASKLCSCGASLSEHDLRQLKSGKSSANEVENHQQWREGLCACVDFWVQQRLAGVERLPHIPREVVERGEASVKTYLADIARSSRDELINRCKVCVVGPSEWGKTSLVQSITIEKPILIERKDRTIGIDLTKTVLSGEDGSQHEVTFWDFAGQDMYQAAHTLFFSRRTLFVLVVDLEAYSKELQLAETETSQENELRMSRFVRSHVFKWVRAIFAQQPDARFLVVGTKANLLEDPDLVEDIWDDLKDRLKEWKADFVKGMEKQIGSKDSRSKEVKDLKSKLAQIASDDWLVAKLTSVDSIAEVRAALQQTLAANDLGFPMWKMYRKVLQAVLKRREAARRAGTTRERIEQSIVRFRTLRKQLLLEIDDLKRDECEQILRTLNDLGDVLWYEHDGAGVFKDHLVLDPMLVIEVVREVVRHDLSASSGIDVAGDGGVPHALLKTFPLWRDMDMELMHAMKELLQHFQLAYPADADTMLPESDLIVPAYWQLIKAASTAPRALASSQSVCDAFITHWWCWEYEVPGELAETIFEKFAVQSHSSSMPRTIRGFCMEAACSEFATSISLRLGHTSRDIVRIEVSGDTEELSWHNMRFYLMKMEKVLDAYRGDVVWRYIVYRDSETGQEKRASVGSVVKLLEDTIVMGRDTDALRLKTPWMPPDMDWYMHKSWNDITTFQQLQMNELVRNKLQVLEKLAIAGDAPRQFPALWSLQYLPEEHKAIVRMHSDLSGRCYHVPIEIDTGSPLLARHASVFKTGLSLCATVVESALSFPIVQAVVNAAKSALEAQADHAARVHNLIDKLDLSARPDAVDTRSTGLSPGASMVLLRDLLHVHNDGLDDLEISEVSNLECAVTASGEYVWAHAHEITAMNGKITRCHSPPSTWRVLEEQEPEPSPAASHSPASSTTNGVQPPSAFKLTLCVESIDGLADWDWHKTYCKWQLYHGKSRVPIASDVTPLHADSSSPPSWHTMKVAVDSVASVAMLRACRLAVQVKRRSRIGWTKLIGVGEISLADFVDQDAEVHFHCEPIRVPLEVATRCVVIQLTA